MSNLTAILQYQDLCQHYIKRYPPSLSMVHFSSVFLWQDHFDFQFEEFKDTLIVFAKNPGASFVYWPLLGKWDQGTVDYAFEKMNAINPRTARFDNISELEIGMYQPCGLNLREKAQEYVYVKDDIIAYKGNDYKSHRHEINVLTKNHQVKVRPFTSDATTGCLNLYDQWKSYKYLQNPDIIAQTMMEENRKVHQLAMNHMSQIGLHGIIVEVDEKIGAYSLGFLLNTETFVVLLEITHPEISGLGAYVFNQMCQQLMWDKYTWVNTMDDFGVANLARSKQSYHPKQQIKIYTGTR